MQFYISFLSDKKVVSVNGQLKDPANFLNKEQLKVLQDLIYLFEEKDTRNIGLKGVFVGDVPLFIVKSICFRRACIMHSISDGQLVNVLTFDHDHIIEEITFDSGIIRVGFEKNCMNIIEDYETPFHGLL